MKLAFYGSCAGLTPDQMSNQRYQVTDLSTSPLSFSDDISELKRSNNGNPPDAFICYGHTSEECMAGIEDACAEHNVPLILCSSKTDETRLKKLAGDLGAGYLRRRSLERLTPHAALIMIRDQALKAA